MQYIESSLTVASQWDKKHIMSSLDHGRVVCWCLNFNERPLSSLPNANIWHGPQFLPSDYMWSMRGLWEGQCLTLKNLTLKKREDSKVFGPTPSDWNCSAEQNSVETRFTPKKGPWAPQVPKEVRCNINHMWASQMHNASNRPNAKKTRWVNYTLMTPMMSLKWHID